MTDLLLRRGGAGDCETIRSVLLATWLETYTPFVPEADLRSYFASAYSPGALLARMALPEVQATLAIVGGRCLGVMLTTAEPAEDRLAVNSLYVLPGEQGKGVGTLLLGEADAIARSRRLRTLWLGVMKQNYRSVDWYRRAGFLFEREEPFQMGMTSVQHLLGSRPVPDQAGPTAKSHRDEQRR